jgi:hypothetical protein
MVHMHLWFKTFSGPPQAFRRGTSFICLFHANCWPWVYFVLSVSVTLVCNHASIWYLSTVYAKWSAASVTRRIPWNHTYEYSFYFRCIYVRCIINHIRTLQRRNSTAKSSMSLTWCFPHGPCPYISINKSKYPKQLSSTNIFPCRSQWPRGLRRGSAAARLLGLWVRIPPESWTFVPCECCLLSRRDPCIGLITYPEESYRLSCV